MTCWVALGILKHQHGLENDPAPGRGPKGGSQARFTALTLGRTHGRQYLSRAWLVWLVKSHPLPRLEFVLFGRARMKERPVIFSVWF